MRLLAGHALRLRHPGAGPEGPSGGEKPLSALVRGPHGRGAGGGVAGPGYHHPPGPQKRRTLRRLLRRVHRDGGAGTRSHRRHLRGAAHRRGPGGVSALRLPGQRGRPVRHRRPGAGAAHRRPGLLRPGGRVLFPDPGPPAGVAQPPPGEQERGPDPQAGAGAVPGGGAGGSAVRPVRGDRPPGSGPMRSPVSAAAVWPLRPIWTRPGRRPGPPWTRPGSSWSSWSNTAPSRRKTG